MTTPKRVRKSKAAKKRRKPAKKKSVRRRKLRVETPDVVPETASGGRQEAAGESEAPLPPPEVGTLHPPSHGRGLIRWGSQDGNPGNKGGGRLPTVVRREIGRIVRDYGLDYLEDVISGKATDQRVVVVSDGKDNGSHSEIHELRVPSSVRVPAIFGAVAASEGMVSPEKPNLQRPRRLRVTLEEVT